MFLHNALQPPEPEGEQHGLSVSFIERGTVRITFLSFFFYLFLYYFKIIRQFFSCQTIFLFSHHDNNLNKKLAIASSFWDAGHVVISQRLLR